MIRFLSLTFILLLAACSEKVGYKVDSYKEYKVEGLAADFKIPSKSWDQLEFKPEPSHGESHETPAPAEGGGHGSPPSESSSSATREIILADVIVYLVSKNPDVIKEDAVKIILPRGGGEIDLADYVSEKRGSFYVGIEVPEFQESQSQKVLFISRTRKRKVDNKIYGAGCNQVFEITHEFQKSMQTSGLKVNTTRERHVSVLGGHFLFSARKGANIYLTQVTFKDSRNKNLFCEEI